MFNREQKEFNVPIEYVEREKHFSVILTLGYRIHTNHCADSAGLEKLKL